MADFPFQRVDRWQYRADKLVIAEPLQELDGA